MRTILPSFLLLFILGHSVLAQYEVGVNMKVYSPLGALNNNITGTPLGVSITGLRKMNKRISLGAELGVSMYTNDTYDHQIGNSNTYIKVDEEDCFWTGHAFARYNLQSNDFYTLYMEGRLGFTTFFSSQIAVESHPQFEDKFEFHGSAFNSALGGGLTLTPIKNSPNIKFDLGISAHNGSKTSYRNMDSPNPLPNGQDTYRSLTDYMDYRIGVLVAL